MAREKLVSLKEAAHAAGVNEEILRKEIETGAIKGEKKNGWFFDEWYVHSSEMEALKARKRNRSIFGKDRHVASRSHATEATSAVEKLEKSAPIQAPVVATFFDKEEVNGKSVGDKSERTESDWRQEYKDASKRVAEELMRPLLERLELQAAALVEKDMIIADQAQQLRLLPDFEKREEEHRAALEQKEQQLDALESKIDLLADKFASETEALQTQIEETELLAALREEKSVLLKEQLESKETEAVVLKHQLTELEAVVAELRKPWWKKVFQ